MSVRFGSIEKPLITFVMVARVGRWGQKPRDGVEEGVDTEEVEPRCTGFRRVLAEKENVEV